MNTALEYMRNALEAAYSRGYAQGVKDGKSAFMTAIAQVVGSDNLPPPMPLQAAPSSTLFESAVLPSALAADDDEAPAKKRRARRGSVREAIDTAYMLSASEVLTYQEIFDCAQSHGYSDIAMSSIRGEMRRRRDRGEAVEVASGQWRLLEKNMAASQQEEATM